MEVIKRVDSQHTVDTKRVGGNFENGTDLATWPKLPHAFVLFHFIVAFRLLFYRITSGPMQTGLRGTEIEGSYFEF